MARHDASPTASRGGVNDAAPHSAPGMNPLGRRRAIAACVTGVTGRPAIFGNLQNPWKTLVWLAGAKCHRKFPFDFNEQKFAFPKIHKDIFGGIGGNQGLAREKAGICVFWSPLVPADWFSWAFANLGRRKSP
jgi:hypothetical protein